MFTQAQYPHREGETLRVRRTVEVRVPFPGFFNTHLDAELSQQEEYAIEGGVPRGDEDGSPAAQALSAEEYADIVRRHTDWWAAYEKAAMSYLMAFNEAADAAGHPLCLQFSALASPKHYNFETDRLFAWIPMAYLYLLMRESRRDEHRRLKARIKRDFTSCPGFHSFYSNDPDFWLAKPLSDWDHNEACTLIEAILDDHAWETWRGERGSFADAVTLRLCNESDWAYDAWSGAVDWAKVDADVEEARADKAAADRRTPDEPGRCPDTLGMNLVAPRG